MLPKRESITSACFLIFGYLPAKTHVEVLQVERVEFLFELRVTLKLNQFHRSALTESTLMVKGWENSSKSVKKKFLSHHYIFFFFFPVYALWMFQVNFALFCLTSTFDTSLISRHRSALHCPLFHSDLRGDSPASHSK